MAARRRAWWPRGLGVALVLATLAAAGHAVPPQGPGNLWALHAALETAQQGFTDLSISLARFAASMGSPAAETLTVEAYAKLQSPASHHKQAAVDAAQLAVDAGGGSQALNLLGEAYRVAGDDEHAVAAYLAAIEQSSEQVLPRLDAAFNLGSMLVKQRKCDEAIRWLSIVLEHRPTNTRVAGLIARCHTLLHHHEVAEQVVRKSIELQPPSAVSDIAAMYLELGIVLYEGGHLEAAKDAFVYGRSIDPSNSTTIESLVSEGAMLQVMGRMDEANIVYDKVLALAPNDARALNNRASILTMQRDYDDAEALLRRVWAQEPNNAQAMVNLANVYAERGCMECINEASDLLYRAYQLSKIDGYLIRRALLLPAVAPNASAIPVLRQEMHRRLLEIQRMGLTVPDPAHRIEHLQFYLVYHGMGDRVLQELVSSTIRSAAPFSDYVAPHLADPHVHHQLTTGSRKIRLGFISKFFVVNHPHAQLIDGIIAGLDRRYFEIIVVSVAHSLVEMSGTIKAAADEIYYAPLSSPAALNIVAAAKLDMIVYADSMSEPISYSLAIARLATVQCMFWGNPVTTGHPSVDYFISADVMEGSDAAAEYSEQLVRLEGQGIWYDAPDIPKVPRNYREELGLDPNWLIIMVPHNPFKIAPSFDHIMRQVLLRLPQARMIFVEGMTKDHQQLLWNRWRQHIPDVLNRMHFVPRQAGGELFLRLLSVADFILHTFPFDGSKTAFDAIIMGVPLVTLPTQMLRSRMALSFFLSMGVLDTVAWSEAEYIDIAVRLGEDPAFRKAVSTAYLQNRHLIWQRQEVILRWQQFLLRAIGYHSDALAQTAAALKSLADKGQSEQRVQLRLFDGWPNNVDRGSVFLPVPAAADVPSSSKQASLVAARRQASALYAQGRLGDAEALLRQTLEPFLTGSMPVGAATLQTAAAFSDLGAVTADLGRSSEGLALLRIAVQIDPTLAQAHNNIGVLLVKAGNIEQAIPHYEAAIKANNTNALYNLARALQVRGTFSMGQLNHVVLQIAGRLEAAMTVLMTALALPPQGWELVLICSQLEPTTWDPILFGQLGEAWAGSGQLPPTPGFLWNTVQHVRSFDPSIPNALVALAADHGDLRDAKAVLQAIELAAARVLPPEPPAATDQRFNPTCNGVHLIIQLYDAAPAQRADILRALAGNLDNEFVERVHVLLERRLSWSLEQGLESDQHVWRKHKLVEVLTGSRLTLAAAYQYAATHLAGCVVMVANADILTDGSLFFLLSRRDLLDQQVIALQRWEWEPRSGQVRLEPRTDSQDSWLFQPPLHALEQPHVLQHLDIPLGVPRVDNRIAAVLRLHGVKMRNPCLNVVTVHMSSTGRRAYEAEDGAVSGEGTHVPLTIRL